MPFLVWDLLCYVPWKRRRIKVYFPWCIFGFTGLDSVNNTVSFFFEFSAQ